MTVRRESNRRSAANERLSHAGRWTLLAACALILCSCRAQGPPPGDPFAPPPDALPASAFTGAPDADPSIQLTGGACAVGGATPGAAGGLPLPLTALGNWSPPGIATPWPEQEYLFDGGDHGLEAVVDHQWQVKGLDLEDTIAHFDTLDGKTHVTPSNRVALYAPRFGAVRSVTDPAASEQIDALVALDTPDRGIPLDGLNIPTTSRQDAQPIAEVGRRRASGYLSPQRDGVASNTLSPRAFQDAFLPFENVSIIRCGIYFQRDRALLVEGMTAAVAWTSDQMAQVILDRQAATAFDQYRAAQVVYTADEVPGCPRLRLIKVASTQWANPGEEVDFTLRYDNVGSAIIGNVTILDNLTTRLEYVADTAQSSREAQFYAEPNQGGSDILRWEIAEPLRPGEGGILRFRCRVR